MSSWFITTPLNFTYRRSFCEYNTIITLIFHSDITEARPAQSGERKALKFVVVGSSPAVGVF